MTDEVYEFMQDCADKKVTARSARNKRTHNGKGGRVRLPSDFLTKKEREAMNGECKSYRMNEPITWEEFNTWPKEHKITYIKLLREKFNAPDYAIAEMMGRDRWSFGDWIFSAGLNVGKNGRPRTWDKDGFLAWRDGVKDGVVTKSEDPVEEVVQPDDPIVIPTAPECTGIEYAPISWKTFKDMPDIFKISYIKYLRAKFNVSDKNIAEMMGISRPHLCKMIVRLGLGNGKGHAASVKKGSWDEEGFRAWCAVSNEPETAVVEPSVEPVEAVEEEKIDIPAASYVPIEEAFANAGMAAEEAAKAFDYIDFTGISAPVNQTPVYPKNGTLTFENNRADDALTMIKILLGGATVNMTVTWEVVDE